MKKKLIVITGATRGLGRAMALGFASRGHVVLGCGRSQEHVKELGDKLASPHEMAVVDVSNDEAVKDWAISLRDRHGPPDLLINNAALMNEPAPLWQFGAETIDDMLRVNIGGTVTVIRHFVPSMIEAGSGIIVNFSSGWGRSTSPEVAPYCATKWAIEGLTKALAQELPEGVATVALNPGIIDTDMLRRCWGETAASCPRPEQWVEAALPYILSFDHGHNGASLTVPI